MSVPGMGRGCALRSLRAADMLVAYKHLGAETVSGWCCGADGCLSALSEAEMWKTRPQRQQKQNMSSGWRYCLVKPFSSMSFKRLKLNCFIFLGCFFRKALRHRRGYEMTSEIHPLIRDTIGLQRPWTINYSEYGTGTVSLKALLS